MAAALGFAAAAQAQPLSPKQLGEAFDKLLAERYPAGGSGAAVLVAQRGKVLYHKAFGMASIELNVPMQPGSVFRIGSITKQFTAVAILQLMEQGKLSLQDEITKFIPDYPVHGHRITIEHLLTHTSGIRSYTDMEAFGSIITQDKSPEELIAFFKNQPMDFAPGTQWNYNNSGYFLLGYIIEQVSGMTYPEYLDTHIFKPLGMKQSYYGSDTRLIPGRAAGYEWDGQGLINAPAMSMSLPYAAGSIQSTVEDLFTWHRALHAGQVVKQETLEQAFREYKLQNGKGTSYGYGWFLGQLQGSRTIEHGGGINGFVTESLYLPAEDVFVALFTNSTRDETSPSLPAAQLAALVIGKPFSFKEIPLRASDAAAYAGVYESETGEQRILRVQNDSLYSERGGGQMFRVRSYGKDKFYFDNSLTTLDFKRNAAGAVESVTSYERTGTIVWKKTDKPIPAPRAELTLPEALLETYVGTYQIAPDFALAVTREGQRLFTQATGQERFEIFASSESRFFLKVVDAQIEFFKNEQGAVDRLMLFQNGQAIAGKKVK